MKNKTLHTRGPWAVHPQALLAVHQPELNCWIPQIKEDAQLIAAAPDLLEALKMALEAPDDDRSWEDDAIAAIARATGGSV